MAAMALLSACENLQVQEPDTQASVSASVSGGASDNQVIFTASLGVDTKTYLEWDGQVYKTLWSEDDYIYVYDLNTGNREYCALVDGAGTTTAKFAGTLESENYLAIYGNINFYGEEDCDMWLSSYIGCSVYYGEDGERSYRWDNRAFPMVAKSTSTSFSFQNICSVLNLSLTGDESQYVEYICLSSNNEDVHMSGEGSLDLSQSEPLFAFKDEYGCQDYVEYSLWTSLSYRPVNVFVVLPAQTYYGGFTVRITMNDGSEREYVITEDIEMRRSRIRTLAIHLGEGAVNTWGLTGSADEIGNWGIFDVPMTLEGNYWVLRDIYLDSEWEFKLRMNNEWTVNYGTFWESDMYVELNQGERVYNNGQNLKVTESGKYDIYLDLSQEVIYIMTPGFKPGDEVPGGDEPLEKSWGICGIMTGWGSDSDIRMDYDGEYYVAYNVPLQRDQYFVIRADEAWDEVYGLSETLSSYYCRYVGAPLNTCVPLSDLYRDIYVGWTGNYDIYFNPDSKQIFIMTDGRSLSDIPTTDCVLSWDYSNIFASYENSSLVKVQGTVMAKTTRGVVLALDNYFYNSIYVYGQSTVLQEFELGYFVELYVTKNEYNGLAELLYGNSDVYWYNILNAQTIDYDAETATDITNDILNYSNDSYEYVRVVGSLDWDGSNYVVYVPGQGALVKIEYPVNDLSSYIGANVSVEGYYFGKAGSYDGIVILKRIGKLDTEGSTNDVYPGGDIIVTPLRMRK